MNERALIAIGLLLLYVFSARRREDAAPIQTSFIPLSEATLINWATHEGEMFLQ